MHHMHRAAAPASANRYLLAARATVQVLVAAYLLATATALMILPTQGTGDLLAVVLVLIGGGLLIAAMAPGARRTE